MEYARTAPKFVANYRFLGSFTNRGLVEKTETAGVYQEMKGQGSTTQTLNQTSLKGNVTFDNALKISAQTTTTAAGVTTATFAGAALNAGFTALASQAAVAMVNNKGDIGKTLEQMGSEQSIKNLLTTMVTAGALNALGSSTLFNG